MDVPPERSKPLHNFALPHLKWGNQRFLRCMKVNNANGQTSGSNRRSSPPEAQSNGFNRRRPGKEVINRRSPNANESSRKSPSKPIGADAVRFSDYDQDRQREKDKDGIEAVREKLMLDLRVAADRMKVSMLDDSNSARPWNLRTRRAACTAPNGGKKPVSCNSSSPLRAGSPMATAKSSRLRGLASAAAAATSSSKQSGEKEEKSERPKFSIALSREEIESDFIAMTGMKPPRRPKRRPKAVQRQLDTLLPGAWLTEITPEAYKVPDFPESGKG